MIFDIWSAEPGPYENVSGVHNLRHYHGNSQGENFQQACYEFAAKDAAFKRKFNPLQMTYNGYKLYPTEQEVLDSFSK